MNIKEIRDMDDAALSAKLAALYKDRIELQIKRATGNLKTTSEWSKMRRTIARILTVQTERQEQANG